MKVPFPDADESKSTSSSISDTPISHNLYDVNEIWFMKRVKKVRLGLLRLEVNEPHQYPWRKFLETLVKSCKEWPLGYGDAIYEATPAVRPGMPSNHQTVQLTQAGKTALAKEGVSSMLIADLKRFFGHNNMDIIYGWDPIHQEGTVVVRNMQGAWPPEGRPLLVILPAPVMLSMVLEEDEDV